MLNYLLVFLAQLEQLIPPPQHCHHVLCRALYGSDADGWSEKLALQVNDHGIFTTYFLDEDDLTKAPLYLAQAIRDMHISPVPEGTELQYAIGAGQFIGHAPVISTSDVVPPKEGA